MNGLERQALLSALHPVEAAASDVVAHIGAARSDEMLPSLPAALEDLDRLAEQTARARTLVKRLLDGDAEA